MPIGNAENSQSVRIALAGCGRMGQLHAQRIATDGRGQVVALFDIDSAAAQALAGSLPRDAPQSAAEAVVYRQFDDLLERAQIDAAIICTPTQLHFEHASAFLNRAVPVLCEKPLARTRSEIDELISAASRSGALLSVGYQRRLLAVYRTMRRLVQSGELGSVQAVLSHNIENWQQTIVGTWRDDPHANPGGFIGDAGSHKIDVMLYVTGLEPTDVFARCDRCGSQVEVTASVSATLSASGRLSGSSNVPLTMDFIGHAQHFSEMLSVQCTQADLLLHDGQLSIASDGHVELCPMTESDSNPVTAFLDSLLGQAENFAPPQCALPVLRLTEAILESARTGRTVAIGSRL